MEDDGGSFETDYPDFETGIAAMVFDGWTDEKIGKEAEMIAASVRAGMEARIGRAVPPAG